jgi:hypothetical protein
VFAESHQDYDDGPLRILCHDILQFDPVLNILVVILDV